MRNWVQAFLLLNDHNIYLAAEILLAQLISFPILFYSKFDTPYFI